LTYTLQTCLTQNHDSFEVVICDNCSSPETRRVVERFGSDRIKYVRSDKLLAMSDNWELAVSQSSGEYVIVVGDDDALLPGALDQLDFLIGHLKAKILRWNLAFYYWPGIPGGLKDNVLWLPLPRENKIINSRQMIDAVVNRGVNHAPLPMIYNGAIHRDLIQQLRDRTGRVFNSRIPDHYSGIAFAYLSKSYHWIGKSLGILGTSPTSTGLAQLYVRGESPIAKDFDALNEAIGFTVHPQVPDLPVLPAMLANDFLRAKECLFPKDHSLRLDRKQLARNCIRSLEQIEESGERWEEYLGAIRASFADSRSLQKWFTKRYMSDYRRQAARIPPAQHGWRHGIFGKYMCLYGDQFGVADVFGAAELGGKILGTKVSKWVASPSLFARVRHAGRVLLKGD
jgi:glycosyltransferase involved in cell wall biosynthesis